MRLGSDTPAGLSFGRFRLLPHRRELLADGQPLKLGGRSFDVLLALVEARGAVLSKDALLARVWPDRVVEENALQSQISALRAAFGAERDLIRTVSGRGYQFTGEIRLLPVVPDDPADAATSEARDARPGARPRSDQAPTNLPEPISELIGRDDALGEILRLAAGHRLVTLTGSGGIGKTRLAVAAARELLPQYADGVWLVELSLVADPALVPAAVAAAVGLAFGPGEVSAQRLAHALADRELLLVLDTCEHVVAAAAALVEAMLRASRAVRLLATSREPLQAEGEWVYPVPPLAFPAEDAEAGDELLRYGAVQLCLERARAANPRFVPDRRVVATIAAICRRLDGIPLALEMAAARSSALPLEEISARLDHRFQLLTAGRRTALPRHQTLRATLDWSYELLPEPERVILRRLGIFAGPFSLKAASVVVASPPDLAPWEVIEGLSMLVSKSLVAPEGNDADVRFRLLDTTRAYALEKLAEGGERESIARRHAEFFREHFEQAEAEWDARPSAAWPVEHRRYLGDLRAALDWTFSPEGDASIGVALTASAVPLWMHSSLLDECRGRVEQALASLATAAVPDARRAMKLNAALGATLMYTRSVTDPEVGKAWSTALDLAERLDDADYQLRALLGVCSSHMRSGHHRIAHELAQRFHSLAAARRDPNDRLIGEHLIGEVDYLGGDLFSARRHLENMLAHYTVSNRWSDIIRFQIDHLSRAGAVLARILWLLGFPDRATSIAAGSIDNAQDSHHAISLCYALAQAACPIALWVGDLERAEQHIDMLLDRSRRHALPLWEGWGNYYKGVLLINRGDSDEGLRLLRAGLDVLGAARFAVRFVTFLDEAVLALGRAGQIAAGLAEVDEAVLRFPHAEERWVITGLLRGKGELLLLQGAPGTAASAESLFRQAIDAARRQGALSWELRAATSLARLLRDQSRVSDALALLQPVYARLTEGFATTDALAAKRLMEELTDIGGR